MKKLVSLMVTFAMILVISIPSFARVEGREVYFTPGTSTEIRMYESINYPWKAMAGSSYDGVVTLYSSSPVKGIEEAPNFKITPHYYLESWSPVYNGSKLNPASKDDNDTYITEFQIRARFLDSNGNYTRPSADASAGDTVEDEIMVILENNQSMIIPCTLEFAWDATIYWDIDINQNVVVDLNKNTSIDAYIGAKDSPQRPFSIKWVVEGSSVDVIDVKGPDGTPVNGMTVNNITKPSDSDLFLGSTITIKPTATHSFWLTSNLYDSNGAKINNWRVQIKVAR